MEDQVEDFIRNAAATSIESPTLTIVDRLDYAKDQVVSTFRKVFPYILVGVGIGALIHNWIPEYMIERILGNTNPFGVILATFVGVPMYADIFGTIPVAEALLFSPELPLDEVQPKSVKHKIMLSKTAKKDFVVCVFINIQPL